MQKGDGCRTQASCCQLRFLSAETDVEQSEPYRLHALVQKSRPNVSLTKGGLYDEERRFKVMLRVCIDSITIPHSLLTNTFKGNRKWGSVH